MIDMEGKAKYRQFTKQDLMWIEQFRKVMKDAPPELFMFIGGTIDICVFSEMKIKGGRGGGIDPDVPHVLIPTPMTIDGGDF